jgi:hypothetical protein
VKSLIPAALGLVVGICVLGHEYPKSAIVPPRLREDAPAPAKPDRKNDVRQANGERERSTPPVGVPVVEKPSGEEPIVLSSRTQEMSSSLRETLGLTEDQGFRVDSALAARAAELQSVQDAIRKSGVFNPRDYGRSLLRMKDSWFRNIDGVLDSRQHVLFVDMVAKGFLRPGTEFLADLEVLTVVR